MDSRHISRYFNHLEFIFVYGVREWSSFILLNFAVQISQHHLLKRLCFFHTGCFLLLCQKLVAQRAEGPFLGSLFCSLAYVSVFVPLPCYHCDHSFVVQLEIRHCDAPSLVFLFNSYLEIRGLFCFHTNLRTICSSSLKNVLGILIGIALKV